MFQFKMYYRPLAHGCRQLVSLSNYLRTTTAAKPEILTSKFVNWGQTSIRVYASERSSARNTIFALSSGAGKCGVMVFRVSGVLVKDVMRTIARCMVNPEPRKAHLRRF